MLKHTLTAAALAAVLAAPAFAQKQPAPDTAANQMSSPPAANGARSNHGMNGASAQNAMSATGAAAEPAGFMHTQDANELRGTKLIGAAVYGPDNKSIGEVNDVLIDKDGRVTAVVVGVGGFLGVGQKNVGLPFHALNVERKQGGSAIDKIAVSYTKQQLKDAPQFAYYKGGAAATTGKAEASANMPVKPNGGNAPKTK